MLPSIYDRSRFPHDYYLIMSQYSSYLVQVTPGGYCKILRGISDFYTGKPIEDLMRIYGPLRNSTGYRNQDWLVLGFDKLPDKLADKAEELLEQLVAA